MLTLGIPSNPVMALMIGALIIQGITPGPNVVTDEPALFWGLIVSMWVGNLMLVLLEPAPDRDVGEDAHHPLSPPVSRRLSPFCCIGAYSVNNNVFDVYAMAMFGLLGYVFIKLDFEPAPLLLGFVLGPMLEENLRRAMIISRGDPTVFVTHPLSLVLLLISAGAARRRPAAQHPRQARGSFPGVGCIESANGGEHGIKDLWSIWTSPCNRSTAAGALTLAKRSTHMSPRCT